MNIRTLDSSKIFKKISIILFTILIMYKKLEKDCRYTYVQALEK